MMFAALAACTVGEGKPTTPAPRPPDPSQMSAATLDTYDSARPLTRPGKGGTNVCGSWCDPCADVTEPPRPAGCLNQLACSSSGGPSGDVAVVVLAIVVVSTRRRRRRVYARRREDDAVLEEHLNVVP